MALRLFQAAPKVRTPSCRSRGRMICSEEAGEVRGVLDAPVSVAHLDANPRALRAPRDVEIAPTNRWGLEPQVNPVTSTDDVTSEDGASRFRRRGRGRDRGRVAWWLEQVGEVGAHCCNGSLVERRCDQKLDVPAGGHGAHQSGLGTIRASEEKCAAATLGFSEVRLGVHSGRPVVDCVFEGLFLSAVLR